MVHRPKLLKDSLTLKGYKLPVGSSPQVLVSSQSKQTIIYSTSILNLDCINFKSQVKVMKELAFVMKMKSTQESSTNKDNIHPF